MILGMPITSFIAFFSWPVFWLVVVILVSRHMSKIEVLEKETEQKTMNGK